MTSPPAGRIIRPKRKRRPSGYRFAVVGLGAIAVAAVVAFILFAVHKLDSLSKPRVIPGYSAVVSTLEEEYRAFYGDVLDRNAEAYQFFIRAEDRAQKSDYVGAVANLERVSRDAAVPVVFKDLGALYFAMRDEAHAIDAYREALARDPGFRAPDQSSKELRELLAKAEPVNTHETEPNNSRDNANLLLVGTLFDGEIADASDVDSLRLIAPPAPRDILTIQALNESATLELGLRMYDSEFRLLDEGRVVGRPGKPVQIETTLQPNRTVYLQLWGADGTTGRYSVRVSPTHAYDRFEPNDTFATATRVQLGSTTQARIMDAKDVDYYVVESPVVTMFTAEIMDHTAAMKPKLAFFGPDRNRINAEPAGSIFGEQLRFQFTIQPKQRYYIEVTSEGNVKGDYTLHVE